MAKGLRRGPVLLRFRSLVDSVARYVDGIVDTRQLSKVRYTLRDCFLSALALFYVLCCAQHKTAPLGAVMAIMGSELTISSGLRTLSVVRRSIRLRSTGTGILVEFS